MPGALMRPALTKTLISCLWYRWGRSATYLLHFFIFSCQLCLQWDVANQEPPCRFQTTCFHTTCFQVLHGFRNLSRWERCGFVGRGSVTFQPISSSSDYGDGSSLLFLGSFHWSIPVRYNWSVFARKTHSTSEFAMIVLSKCVIHAGFVMVAWTLGGIPF